MIIQTQLRIQENSYQKLKIIAEEQGRSANKQICFILDQFIKDYEKINGKINLPEE
jgi:hypothetical protein